MKIIFYILLLFLVTHHHSCSTTIKDSCLNPVLLISTINGRIHAIEIDDLTDNLNVLWSLDTEKLISSSIDKLELYNDDNSLLRIIPSLDGNLFAYYPATTPTSGDHLERIPFNLDDLLKTSVKLNNKITIIGGMLTQTLGIDLRNGHVIYNCSSNGCDTSTIMSKIKIDGGEEEEEEETDDAVNNLIVIKQSKNLLRAISIENGLEKWNISLIKNEIIRYPMCNRNLEANENKYSKNYDQRFNLERINHIKNHLRFNVSKGLIKYRLSVPSLRNFNLINLNSPIATCDLLYNGILKPINIFSRQQQQQQKNNQLVEVVGSSSPNRITRSSSVYLGRFDSQYYAQNTIIDEESDELSGGRGEGFKKILENKELLLKTKSTRNNLAVVSRNSNRKTDNSLVSAKKNNYETFLSSGVVRQQEQQHEQHQDKDYDDDDSDQDDDSDYENNQSYSLLVPDDSLLFSEYDYLFNKNLNNYIYMISSYKQLFNTILHLTGIVFFILFLLKSFRSEKITKQVSTEQVLISPPSHKLLNHQNSLWSASTKSLQGASDSYLQEDSESGDSDSDDESAQSRYLSEFDHIRLIGKGGFGYVFEAKHKIDERVFAIKRIRLKNRKDAKEKVLREVRTLAKLESPYIVRYFHSWFEKHSYEWQRRVDKEKLLNKEESSGDDDFIGSSSLTQFTGETGTNTTFMSNETESRTDNFRMKTKRKRKIRDNTSSSFIVFENSGGGGESDNEVIEEEDEFIEEVKETREREEALYIYIQMELCQRETLRHWLDRFKNETRGRLQIFTIFEQILNAISYIHSQDLIHRDLKPSNIFLSLDGKFIKIGDFGLVVSAETQIDDEEESSGSNNTRKKSRKSNDGTYLYMSPEQLSGFDYDYKVDIYSLGIILFELIVSFSTQMERIDALKKLNKQVFPVNFECKHEVESKLIKLLINENPNLRPNSNEIAKHELFDRFKHIYSPCCN